GRGVERPAPGAPAFFIADNVLHGMPGESLIPRQTALRLLLHAQGCAADPDGNMQGEIRSMSKTMTTLLALPALVMAVSFVSNANADAKAQAGADKSRSGKPLIQMHPLPQSVASSGTVTLHCGRHYHATRNLDGRSNVIVRTEGDCGKAVITPA